MKNHEIDAIVDSFAQLIKVGIHRIVEESAKAESGMESFFSSMFSSGKSDSPASSSRPSDDDAAQLLGKVATCRFTGEKYRIVSFERRSTDGEILFHVALPNGTKQVRLFSDVLQDTFE